MDPEALTDTGSLPPNWDAFRYDGLVTLDGLIDLAFIITCVLYGPFMQIEADIDEY